jgi:hypothetical protein
MKKGGLILFLGLLLGAGAFAGFYLLGTASTRVMLRESQPELLWLKKEFKLGDAEFDRIARLHAAYLPQCRERCRRIEAQNQKLRQLLAQADTLTPEIQDLLAQRAHTRAECEAEMLKHFLAVSRTMPPAQGRRYLAWVQQQTFMHGQGMEAHHHTTDQGAADEPHP